MIASLMMAAEKMDGSFYVAMRDVKVQDGLSAEQILTLARQRWPGKADLFNPVARWPAFDDPELVRVYPDDDGEIDEDWSAA